MDTKTDLLSELMKWASTARKDKLVDPIGLVGDTRTRSQTLVAPEASGESWILVVNSKHDDRGGDTFELTLLRTNPLQSVRIRSRLRVEVARGRFRYKNWRMLLWDPASKEAMADVLAKLRSGVPVPA